MIIQGCKCWDMTMADRIRSNVSNATNLEIAKRLGTIPSYVAKCLAKYNEAKLETKWQKRMAKDLVRGMKLGDITFISFTKSKEYIDIENSRGMLERFEAFELLSQWRYFYNVYEESK